jgi:hypothetical protein
MEPKSNYLKPEWWRDWLEKIFPENIGYRHITHEVHRNGFQTMHWYKSGDVFFSLYCNKGSRPNYYVKIAVEDGAYLEKVFDLENAETEIQFIEALANPELLPLCINTPYATPFIVHQLKNYKKANSQ